MNQVKDSLHATAALQRMRGHNTRDMSLQCGSVTVSFCVMTAKRAVATRELSKFLQF